MRKRAGAALIDSSKSWTRVVKPLQREVKRGQASGDSIPGQTGRLHCDSQGSGGRGCTPEIDTERRISAAGHKAAVRHLEIPHPPTLNAPTNHPHNSTSPERFDMAVYPKGRGG